MELKQLKKVYAGIKCSARCWKFISGSYVRVLLPGQRKKGQRNFSLLLKIIAPRGPLSFLLEDRKVWHTSKFTKHHGIRRLPATHVRKCRTSPGFGGQSKVSLLQHPQLWTRKWKPLPRYFQEHWHQILFINNSKTQFRWSASQHTMTMCYPDSRKP